MPVIFPTISFDKAPNWNVDLTTPDNIAVYELIFGDGNGNFCQIGFDADPSYPQDGGFDPTSFAYVNISPATISCNFSSSFLNSTSVNFNISPILQTPNTLLNATDAGNVFNLMNITNIDINYTSDFTNWLSNINFANSSSLSNLVNAIQFSVGNVTSGSTHYNMLLAASNLLSAGQAYDIIARTNINVSTTQIGNFFQVWVLGALNTAWNQQGGQLSSQSSNSTTLIPTPSGTNATSIVSQDQQNQEAQQTNPNIINISGTAANIFSNPYPLGQQDSIYSILDILRPAEQSTFIFENPSILVTKSQPPSPTLGSNSGCTSVLKKLTTTQLQGLLTAFSTQLGINVIQMTQIITTVNKLMKSQSFGLTSEISGMPKINFSSFGFNGNFFDNTSLRQLLNQISIAISNSNNYSSQNPVSNITNSLGTIANATTNPIASAANAAQQQAMASYKSASTSIQNIFSSISQSDLQQCNTVAQGVAAANNPTTATAVTSQVSTQNTRNLTNLQTQVQNLSTISSTQESIMGSTTLIQQELNSRGTSV